MADKTQDTAIVTTSIPPETNTYEIPRETAYNCPNTSSTISL